MSKATGICTKCGGVHDGGHHSYCIQCNREWHSARYGRLHPRVRRSCEICGDDITGKKADAQTCGKSCGIKRSNQARTSAQVRESGLRRMYGITQQDYDQLLAVQSGGCAVCGGSATTSPGGVLHVDHCHATGRVRGLLCADCNRAIGQMKDDPARLRRAADYVEATASV